MEIPVFLVLTGNSPEDRLKALRQFIFHHDDAVSSRNITLQSRCLLRGVEKDQRARGMDAAKRRANLLPLPAHLAESRDFVQAPAGCTHTEKKLVMPRSPCLQPEGLRYTHSLKAPLPLSGPAALLVCSSTRGALTPERSGCKQKPGRLVSL